MRAFLAIVPPPSALAPLVRAVGGLRGSYAASWVPEERLHVTLAFLGEISEDKAARSLRGCKRRRGRGSRSR